MSRKRGMILICRKRPQFFVLSIFLQMNTQLSLKSVRTLNWRQNKPQRRLNKYLYCSMCACSGLWDSLSHRSFAGLTTQTQFHHNRFDKRPESVYRETQESRSDTAGIGLDTISSTFPSNRFFFSFFFLSRQQSQQQQSAPTVHYPLWGKSRYCVWALGSLRGNVLRFLAYCTVISVAGQHTEDLSYDPGQAFKMAWSDPGFIFINTN